VRTQCPLPEDAPTKRMVAGINCTKVQIGAGSLALVGTRLRSGSRPLATGAAFFRETPTVIGTGASDYPFPARLSFVGEITPRHVH
jgi:hypothetical protein